jgi:hypothetical protein
MTDKQHWPEVGSIEPNGTTDLPRPGDFCLQSQPTIHTTPGPRAEVYFILYTPMIVIATDLCNVFTPFAAQNEIVHHSVLSDPT